MNIKSAIASLNFEGLTPSDFAIELAQSNLSKEEKTKKILEHYEVSICSKKYGTGYLKEKKNI